MMRHGQASPPSNFKLNRISIWLSHEACRGTNAKRTRPCCAANQARTSGVATR